MSISSIDSWNAPFERNPASLSLIFFFRVFAETAFVPVNFISVMTVARPSSIVKRTSIPFSVSFVDDETFTFVNPFSR